MDYVKIYVLYERLQKDKKNLLELAQLEHSSESLSKLNELQSSFDYYEENLLSLVQQNFPETRSDLREWTDANRKYWFNFLVSYPAVWKDRIPQLIGLFWVMESVRELKFYGEQVSCILQKKEMLDYAKSSPVGSVVQAMLSLLFSYSSPIEYKKFVALIENK